MNLLGVVLWESEGSKAATHPVRAGEKGVMGGAREGRGRLRLWAI